MITSKVKTSFSKSVKSYAKHGSLQREVSKKLFEVFPLNDSSPLSVLDIGSGTGFTSIEAINSSPNATLTPVDIAFPMSQESKKNGFARSITAEATSLPFTNGSFSSVVSSLAFQWIEAKDIAKLYKGIYPLLQAGGTFQFSTVAPGTLIELHEAYDKGCRICTGKKAEFMKIVDRGFMEERLVDAGFKNINWKKITHLKEYGNVGLLFKALKGVGATMPGRPKNRPRRDVLEKAVEIYEANGLPIKATYEIYYMECSKPI